MFAKCFMQGIQQQNIVSKGKNIQRQFLFYRYIAMEYIGTVLIKNCQQNNGDKAADADCNTAERTLNLADFHRFGGADNVAAAADGNTLGNGASDFENSAQQRCKHRTLNPCDEHGNNGDTCKTAV